MTILGRFSYGRCIFEPDWRRSELARTSRRLQIVADSAPRRPREPALRSGLVKNKRNTSGRRRTKTQEPFKRLEKRHKMTNGVRCNAVCGANNKRDQREVSVPVAPRPARRSGRIVIACRSLLIPRTRHPEDQREPVPSRPNQ